MSGHFDGFVPVHGIFYSVFHPTEGTKVRHQFPSGCLELSDITFDTIKNYVIPKPQLCNKLLTFKYGPFRLVCYPVNVVAPYYARNSFSFDFVFVFPYDCATSPYEPAIERLGKMFTVLEEQSQILSKAENSSVYFQLKARNTQKHGNTETAKGTEQPSSLDIGEIAQPENQGYASAKYYEILKDLEGPSKKIAIGDLITKIYRDLNDYSECLIPIDSGNAVDIKLFPLLSPPSSCFSIEDVPISTVNLAKLIDVNWDPTMLKIVPHINGINSIAKVAKFSDSDVNLVVECIKHLIYYNCVILTDIFQFSNIYASTNELSRFLTEPTLAAECQIYVAYNESAHLPNLPFERGPSRSGQGNIRDRSSNGTLDILRKGKQTPLRENSFNSGMDFLSNKHQHTPQSRSSSIPYHNTSDASFGNSDAGLKGKLMPFTSKSCLFDLYRSLTQGQTIREWYKTHFEKIRAARIDVRRFITFGVLHGLIYRSYSYPVLRNIGFAESVEALGATNHSRYAKYKHLLKTNQPLNNVLSAADIRIGLENAGFKARSEKLKQHSTADAAEEVLSDVYRKLALSDKKTDHVAQGNNPISKVFGRNSEDSTDISTRESANSMGSDIKNKVAFDVRKTLATSSADERRRSEILRSIEEKRNEELILLKSVRSVHNFDKICTLLGKDRERVESMLSELGPYNVLHS
ncbi:nitrogen permease regulating protein NPR2 [Lachancea thermotolerans CBS 6340]|uniref:KLTH0C11308p n=1 Tax=Lachancea thermotolerans (strain ATCC 56472 / CBS 6340 / NRRL Y-8284) TaxID=559295 RepID=C5DEQ8_LACTC|nr:KLTH0C11308p [Lachancea thermotolerans CBS 6340]CAR22269.1 KLTH0C11308p [Lachancea thermotolerans CBS 6340]